MTVSVRPSEAQPADRLQMQFLELLPRVETHARITFRFLRCRDLREDKVQESVALAWQWFLRLAGQGKDVDTFLVTFCRLLVRAVRAGRRVCGMHRSKDVLNPLAQQRFGFRVERLPSSTRCSHDSLSSPLHGQKQHDAFEERLKGNTITPVVDQVIFRLDWPRFFRTLSRRDRSLANFLSKGNTNKLAYRKFKLSPGRVTQLRNQWCREWRIFQGDISDQPVLPPNPS